MTKKYSQVLDAVKHSPIALTAADIATMGVVDTKHVSQTLAFLYKRGMIQRYRTTSRKASTFGRRPYAYYISELHAAKGKTSTIKPEGVGGITLTVGDYTLTVAQARDLYAQLKELFGN